MNKPILFAAATLVLFSGGCQKSAIRPDSSGQSAIHFILLPASETGVDFENTLVYNDSVNCYTFRNFYNGGGVGIGDVNNDGLQDLFFCGNQAGNRLFLNRGNFHFEDITEKAGLASKGVWTTGVALADINNDGWLDIYCCKSGPPDGPRRANELFINNGAIGNSPPPGGPGRADWAGAFHEKASDFGLNNKGLSTHAAFFDYDLDGDLDLYLLNNSLRSVGGYDLIKDLRNTPDPLGGNKFFRNDGQKFSDITREAGIFSSAIGFGLGVTVGDFDRDGWPDLFVSNDFFERDYLYRNRQNGTFEEILEQAMPEISMGSMGADMADLNNDGWPEIFVTEMLPRDDARLKTKAQFDNWNKFRSTQKAGYHNQFSRNALHLNCGLRITDYGLGKNPSRTIGTIRNPQFQEIARLAGIEATDWSWGALLADFDNDGWKDIFVANGIGKDLLDQDYISFFSDPAAMRKVLRDNPGQGIVKLIDQMPSQPLANYFFRNRGDSTGFAGGGGAGLAFQNEAKSAGLATPGFSNGSAYGDLDNDGDLDLVVNNVNQPCFIYRNETITDSPPPGGQGGANWLKINALNGKSQPVIGAKATVWAGGKQLYLELNPMRGFMSTVDSRLNFGLGSAKMVDSLLVEFPGGGQVFQKNIASNQTIELRQPTEISTEKTLADEPSNQAAPYLSLVSRLSSLYEHRESEFSDFDAEPLLFQMLSVEGPCLAQADLNADGQPDFFIGGAAEQAGQVFFGKKDGSFFTQKQPDFESDKAAEDVAAAFFDADGDGDQDLYVGSGSSEFQPGDPRLADRLYLNDGKGRFKQLENALPPSKPFLTAAVAPADFDKDGDVDIFVAMRSFSGSYGQPTGGFLLKNDGQGNFRPATDALQNPQKLGMLTDAAWADFNADGWPDLLTIGDWTGPKIHLNQRGKLIDATDPFFEKQMNGWWTSLAVADLDSDGDLDLVAGNHGLNSRFRATPGQPVTMILNDFDKNGSFEPILSQFNDVANFSPPSGGAGGGFPMVLRNDLVRQLPFLKKKYLQFDSYKNQSVEQIFTAEQLAGALRLEANRLETGIFLNENGRFRFKPLPMEAQVSPVFAIAVDDFTGDGRPDILLGGNHLRCKPETGTFAASYGTLLEGDGRGQFSAVPMSRSGLFLPGATRDFLILKNGKKRRLLVGQNDGPLAGFEF